MSRWLAGLTELSTEALLMAGTGVAVLLGAIATAWKGLRARPPTAAPPPSLPSCTVTPAELRDIRDQIDRIHDILIKLEDRTRR